MPDLTFKVQGVSESHARIRVQSRNFSIVVDEPPALGGTDAGPNPVEYVLAALAGCLNVVGHIVAQEMQFTIQSLAVNAEGVLNPERLMNKPTEDRAGYKVVRVTLRVKADADAATLARWAEQVEQRCPVSDNLGSATPLQVTIEPAA